MIILIGGSSHVGKTLLAQRLLEETGFPYVSLDHLKMAFIRTGRTTSGVEDDDDMREFLWPFAAEMAKTAIENNQNLILEGCYIPADWRNTFEPEYLCEIRCLFLLMSEAYLRNHFDDVCAYADVIETRKEEGVNLERLVTCSRWFRDLCMQHDTPFYLTDRRFDLEDMVKTVLKKL